VSPLHHHRRASTAITIGVVAALAASLTGCGEGSGVKADYAKICRDNSTQKRLPDDDCNNHGGAAGWYYFPVRASGTRVPAVGKTATGGVTSLPAGKSAESGVSSKGGSVSRGGFGGSGEKGGFGG
jgi:hypothetical protein